MFLVKRKNQECNVPGLERLSRVGSVHCVVSIPCRMRYRVVDVCVCIYMLSFCVGEDLSSEKW